MCVLVITLNRCGVIQIIVCCWHCALPGLCSPGFNTGPARWPAASHEVHFNSYSQIFSSLKSSSRLDLLIVQTMAVG